MGVIGGGQVGGDGSPGSGGGPVGGDLSGTQIDATVVGLRTIPISSDAATPGDVLTFIDGTAKWAAGGGAGPLPVGQDLTGTTAAAIVTAIQGTPVDATPPAIDDALVGDGIGWIAAPISSFAIAGDATGTLGASTVEAVQGQPWSATAPSAGQVPTWDGTKWEPTATPSYTATRWADPSGDATSTGLTPSKPTTLDNALSLASVGDLIILAGGTHTLAAPISVAVRIAAQAERAAAISSAVTVAVAGVEIVGVRLLDAFTDTSAAAGTTRLRRCSIAGASTVAAPAASQVLELDGCAFADLTVVTSSGGATVRAINSSTGGTLTHATTGAVLFEIYQSTIVSIVCAGGGSISTIGWGSNFTGGAGIVVASGTPTATTLAQVRIGTGPDGSGVLSLPGAPAASVRLAYCEYNTLGSTIPVGARVSAHGEGEGTITIAVVPTTNPPSSPVTYLTYPASGQLHLDPFGIYEATTNFTWSVSANNTAIWADLLINGSTGPIGAIEEQLGKANAQSTRAVYAIFPGAAFGSLWSVSLIVARSPIGAIGTVTMRSGAHSIKRVA